MTIVLTLKQYQLSKGYSLIFWNLIYLRMVIFKKTKRAISLIFVYEAGREN